MRLIVGSSEFEWGDIHSLLHVYRIAKTPRRALLLFVLQQLCSGDVVDLEVTIGVLAVKIPVHNEDTDFS